MKTVGKYLQIGALLFSLALLLLPSASGQEISTLTGKVISSSRNTLTIQTSEGRYQLFVLDRNVQKPAVLAAGSFVRVTSRSGDSPGIRLASQIVATDSAASAQAATEPGLEVPPEIRRVEREIERQARRLQLGVRAGVALDPELILLGVQMQVGPFFGQNVYFRPNVEFAFGEVTSLFALNPEIIYRLPLNSAEGRWSTYVGAGPGFNFLHQNFQRLDGSGGKRIDFGDFKSDVGLNILGGIRYRSGMFAELKTSIYSEPSPTLRLIVGYSFRA